jgi:hypothetical protein
MNYESPHNAAWGLRGTKPGEDAGHGQNTPDMAGDASGLQVWDAGGDDDDIPPRQWLLGNTFCRQFLSGLIGDGGTGKTALRYLQLLSLATGRALTGEMSSPGPRC